MLRVGKVLFTILNADVKEQPKEPEKPKHKNDDQGFKELFDAECERLKNGGDKE